MRLSRSRPDVSGITRLDTFREAARLKREDGLVVEDQRKKRPRKTVVAFAAGSIITAGFSIWASIEETHMNSQPSATRQLHNSLHAVQRPVLVAPNTTAMPSVTAPAVNQQQIYVTTTTAASAMITQGEVAQANQELRQANASLNQIQQMLQKPLHQVSKATQSIDNMEKKIPQTKTEIENWLKLAALGLGTLIILDISMRLRSNRKISGRFNSLEGRLGKENDRDSIPDGAA